MERAAVVGAEAAPSQAQAEQAARALLRQLTRRSIPRSRLTSSSHAPPRPPPPPATVEETTGQDVVFIAQAMQEVVVSSAVEVELAVPPPPPPQEPPALDGAELGLLEALPTELMQRVISLLAGSERDHTRRCCKALRSIVDHTPVAAVDELAAAWTSLVRKLLPPSWLLREWRRSPPLALASVTAEAELLLAVARIEMLRRPQRPPAAAATAATASTATAEAAASVDVLVDVSASSASPPSSPARTGRLNRWLWRRRTTAPPPSSPRAAQQSSPRNAANEIEVVDVRGGCDGAPSGACSPASLDAILTRWEGEDAAWAATLTPSGREALAHFLREACRARYACRATRVRMRLAPKSAPLHIFETPTEHELLVLEVTAGRDIKERRLHAFIKCSSAHGGHAAAHQGGGLSENR